MGVIFKCVSCPYILEMSFPRQSTWLNKNQGNEGFCVSNDLMMNILITHSAYCSLKEERDAKLNSRRCYIYLGDAL